MQLGLGLFQCLAVVARVHQVLHKCLLDNDGFHCRPAVLATFGDLVERRTDPVEELHGALFLAAGQVRTDQSSIDLAILTLDNAEDPVVVGDSETAVLVVAFDGAAEITNGSKGMIIDGKMVAWGVIFCDSMWA